MHESLAKPQEVVEATSLLEVGAVEIRSTRLKIQNIKYMITSEHAQMIYH